MKTLLLFPAAAAISLFSSAVIAQPMVSYTSPISDYQPFVDEKVTSWKAANDNVGQIGGWRVYAKEAQQPENTPTLAPTVAPTNVKPDPKAGKKP